MSRVSPIRLYGANDLARIEACAAAPLRAWAGQWLLPGAGIGAVKAAPCGEAAAELPLRCLGMDGQAWLGAACIGERTAGLVRALFGEAPARSERLASTLAVAEAALDDLNGRLLQALTGAPVGDGPAWTREAGTAGLAARLGDVELRVQVGTVSLCLVAGAEAAGALLRAEPRAVEAKAAPCSRQAAVEGVRVRLEAALAPVELPLSELLGMRPGDVVLFPHRLDEPVLVRTAGGRPVGRALLGAYEGRRAAQMTDSR